MLGSSWTNACVSRMPERLSWKFGVHHCDAVSRELVGPGRLAPEHHGRHGQGQHHTEGRERQVEIEEEQCDPDPGEGAEAHHRRQETGLEQGLERVDVGGHPRHDPARHLPLVVVE